MIRHRQRIPDSVSCIEVDLEKQVEVETLELLEHLKKKKRKKEKKGGREGRRKKGRKKGKKKGRKE